jgi:hypothetical protein
LSLRAPCHQLGAIVELAAAVLPDVAIGQINASIFGS